MKNIILMLLLISTLSFYGQSKDTLYIRFKSDKDCKCQHVNGRKNNESFWVKKEYDSILFIKKNDVKDICIRKGRILRNNKLISACDLVDLKAVGFVKLAETKQFYIVIEKGRKFILKKIDESSYYQRTQD